MTVIGPMETLLWPRTPTGMKTNSQCVTPTGPKTPGILSQNDTPGRRLVLSPRIDFALNPNDDETERARVRAARAEQRRRSFGGYLQSAGTGQTSVASQEEDRDIISQEALSAMLENCLKLANANKINQGNTWDLNLIDHMSDLVKNDNDDDEQTNFQRASYTLETGVKIYSCRVDSVHSEAYKLLGGLSRSANEQTSESPVEDETDQDAKPPQGSKEAPKKAGSTFLASNETINLKKIDAAFNVDPLFHQMSALFDDVGAKGLLLNNLSVYSGCEVVFDSSEVPELKMKVQAALVKDRSLTVDFSFMKAIALLHSNVVVFLDAIHFDAPHLQLLSGSYIAMADTLEQMMDALRQEPEMTPTLKEIVKLLDDPRRAEFEAERAQAGQPSQTPDAVSPVRSWSDAAEFDGAQDDDPGDIFNEGVGFENLDSGSLNGRTSSDSRTWIDNDGDQEDNDEEGDASGEVFMSQDPLEWLAMSTGMAVKSNAWAGPDHWKYIKPKDTSDDPNSFQVDTEGKGKKERKKKLPFSLDFNVPAESDLLAFDPPMSPKTLLLPKRTVPQSTLLPEDFHFEAPSLAKFILRASVWVFRRRSWRSDRGGPPVESLHDMSNEAVWGEDDDPVGQWEDEAGHSDVEDPNGTDLVPEPRKVQKIDITYDKHAKQVDVRLLKVVLWEQVQHGSSVDDQDENLPGEEKGLSFQKILRHFPEDCPAAAPEDISVHLCFICLLHLANEHSLRIDDCSAMDDLRIFVSLDDSDVPGS